MLDDLKTPLTPFRSFRDKDTETFWTSLSSEHTQTFGYTYPDIKKDAAITRTAFEKHHLWSLSPRSGKGWKPSPPAELEPLDLSEAQVFKDHLEYVKPARAAPRTNSMPMVSMQRSNEVSSHGIKTQGKVSVAEETTIQQSNASDSVQPLPNTDIPKDETTITQSEGIKAHPEWFVDEVIPR